MTDERLLGFHPMASMDSTVPMHSHLIGHEVSWAQYVEKKIQPEIDWGLRRFVLHLPFGKREGPGSASFDSLVAARQRKLELIDRGFVRAIRALTEQGIEVICYMGALALDDRMFELIAKPHGDDKWLDRFMDSIRPAISAGCSIAFGAAGESWNEDGPEHYAAQTLRTLGTKVYIEGTAYPKERVRWLASFDWLANSEHYWRNIADSRRGNTRPGRTEGWISPWAQVGELYNEFHEQGMLVISRHAAPLMPDGSKMAQDQVEDTYHIWAPEMLRTDLSAGFDVALWLSDISARFKLDELLVGHKRPLPPSSIPKLLSRRGPSLEAG